MGNVANRPHFANMQGGVKGTGEGNYAPSGTGEGKLCPECVKPCWNNPPLVGNCAACGVGILGNMAGDQRRSGGREGFQRGGSEQSTVVGGAKYYRGVAPAGLRTHQIPQDPPQKRGKLFYSLLEFFCFLLSFFAYSPERLLLDALSHCKQKSSNCKRKSTSFGLQRWFWRARSTIRSPPGPKSHSASMLVTCKMTDVATLSKMLSLWQAYVEPEKLGPQHSETLF